MKVTVAGHMVVITTPPVITLAMAGITACVALIGASTATAPAQIITAADTVRISKFQVLISLINKKAYYIPS